MYCMYIVHCTVRTLYVRNIVQCTAVLRIRILSPYQRQTIDLQYSIDMDLHHGWNQKNALKISEKFCPNIVLFMLNNYCRPVKIFFCTVAK